MEIGILSLFIPGIFDDIFRNGSGVLSDVSIGSTMFNTLLPNVFLHSWTQNCKYFDRFCLVYGSHLCHITTFGIRSLLTWAIWTNLWTLFWAWKLLCLRKIPPDSWIFCPLDRHDNLRMYHRCKTKRGKIQIIFKWIFFFKNEFL